MFSLYGYAGAVWITLGSTPVGVGPGKPTTDSGGKTEELTSAVVARVSDYQLICLFGMSILPEGGKTSEVGDPAFDNAWIVVGAASLSTANASTAAACAAQTNCILKCWNTKAKLCQAFAQQHGRRSSIYRRDQPRRSLLSSPWCPQASLKLDKLAQIVHVYAAVHGTALAKQPIIHSHLRTLSRKLGETMPIALLSLR